MTPTCLVLFDGAGLARLGLERAGWACTGVELDPDKHRLSVSVGSGNVLLADARSVDASAYDAVWASPPCQWHSAARTQGDPVSDFATDLLAWSLALPNRVLWVENVSGQGKTPDWGYLWNAAQFEAEPRQNRNRLIGGRHPLPLTFHGYRRAFPGICPTVTATEYKGCATDKRRASRWYGRKLTVDECAYRQGFDIPDAWRVVPDGWTEARWRRNVYEAIGNGVPTFMAEAFGLAAKTLY